MDRKYSVAEFLECGIVESFPNRQELQKKICKALWGRGEFNIRAIASSVRIPTVLFTNGEKQEIETILAPYKLRLGMDTEQLDAYAICDSENPDSNLFLDLENYGFKCSQFTLQILKAYDIRYWIDLVIYTENDLLSLSGIGAKTVEEIKQGVNNSKYGFKLGMTLDDIRSYCHQELNVTNVIEQCARRIAAHKDAIERETNLFNDLNLIVQMNLEPKTSRNEVRKVLNRYLKNK